MIFTKFGVGRESQDPTITQNFAIVALKNVGLEPPK